MGYLPLHLYLFLLLAFSVGVNSQDDDILRCFRLDNCGGTTITIRGPRTLVSNECCNYPRNGSNALGYSYQFIGDEECTSCRKVAGFFNAAFTAEESSDVIRLSFGYISGAPPDGFPTAMITVSGMSADPTDYTLQVAQGLVTLFPNVYAVEVLINHNPDGIAQERPEQYELKVTAFQNFPDFGFEGAIGTIIDTDVVTFFFSETDHSVNEGADPPVIRAPLSIESGDSLANPVVFRVLPITIQEAQDQGDPLPSGVTDAIDKSNSRSPIEAIPADFNTTVFNVTFPADPSVNSIDTIRVNVVDDDINEATEQLFLIEIEVVEAVNPSTILFSRNVTIGIIVDNDPIRIGFIQPSYTFDEPQSVPSVSLLLVKENNQSTEQTFDVKVTIVPPSSITEATIGEDYSPEFDGTSTILRFLSSALSVPVNLRLFPDNIAEGDEGFRVTSDSEGEPKYTLPTRTSSVFRFVDVTIRDNDPIVFGFEEPQYTVNEGESIQICANVTNPPVDLPLSLQASAFLRGVPVGGNAVSSDYSARLSYTIINSPANSPTLRRLCGSFSAVNDGIVENVEYVEFFLEFALPPQALFALRPNLTEVVIVSTDVATVGFIGAPYFVNESAGTATLTIGVISGDIGVNVTLDVQLQNGSAEDPDDFNSTLSSSTIILTSANRRVDVTFPIVDDQFFELNEDLFATLSFAPGGGNSRVLLDPDMAQVIIMDDDELIFGFNQTLYQFSEDSGFQNTYIALLNGSLSSIAVTLAAETQPALFGDMATVGEDYLSSSSMSLFFDENISFEEFGFDILEDNITERTESFSVALIRVVSINVGGIESNFTEEEESRILFNPGTATVNILDNDETTIGFNPVTYDTVEGSGPVMFMFGVLSGTLGFTVDVGFRTVNDTAYSGSDYIPVEQTVGFIGMESNTVSVDLVDDEILEGTETFGANLFAVGSFPSNVMLDPVVATAQVVDDDDIVIGFSPDVYSVSEGGVVNFNITVIKGTLIKEFEVQFFTSEGDATGSADYVSTTRTLTFSMSVLSHVVSVMVLNDDILENEEEFYGNLSLAEGTSASVILMPSIAPVTITDSSSGIVIGFSGNYTVVEGSSVDLELMVLSGSLAREVVLSISTSNGTAQAPVDYTSFVSEEVAFLPGEVSALVRVTTNADNTVEFSEYFTARANLVSTDASVTIDPEITFVTIEDNDKVVIGFSPDVYSALEPDGSVTLMASVLSGVLARPVQISFFTTDGSATSTSPEDFVAVSNLVLEFNATTLSHQINVDIIDDNILENPEVFYGNLSTVDDSVQLAPAAATVTIMEATGDDVVTIGFSPQNYTVNEEDGSVMLTVLVIGGILERNVTVPFFTSSGTATQEDPMDYEGVSTVLTFTPTEDAHTVTIMLFDDTIVEGSEYFNGNIDGTQDLVIASPDQATIVVNENSATDRITVGFDPASYTVNETAGSVTFSVRILSGMLERSAVINFFTTDGTATSVAPMDYMEESTGLVFDRNTMVHQVQVTIVNDNAIENSEFFYGNLSTSDVAVDLAPDVAPVTILEVPGDDVIVVGFTDTSIMVMEDEGPVLVCVALMSLQSLLEREVVVMLRTLDGSAIYPEDYLSLTDRITFSRTSPTMVCVNITIEDDGISEGPQQFEAVLNSTDRSVVLSPDMATITINDDDDVTIGFVVEMDSVSENAGSIDIFVEVRSGTLQRNVVVDFSTLMSLQDAATIGVDFEATSGQLTFNSNTNVLSFPVTILSDDVAEGPEIFLLQLMTSAQRVTLDPDMMEVEIVDDDVVTIGFLQNTYTGIESDRYVTLTVGVTNGRLERDFVVTLASQDQNVSNAATASEDYQSFSVDLTFSGTTNSTNFNVSLQDDSVTENREEFLATLTAVTTGTSAQVSPRVAEVFIVDNDRITVGFDPDSYTVNEVDGTAALTVMILDGTLDRSAVVNFFTTDGTATSTFPEDFTAVTQTSIIFDAATTSHVVRVSIVDDDAVESSEFFYGNLSTMDSAVVLDPSSAIVTILETDGDDNIRIGFDPDSRVVNENDSSTTLTVRILEGSLERDAVVFFSTTDGSATSTAPTDFVGVTNRPLTFSSSTNSDEIIITIVDDSIVENSEFFFGNLSSTDNAVILDPSVARVTINEAVGDDTIRVGFDPENYAVNETDGSVNLIVRVLEGVLERDAVVSFSTSDGTATSIAPADFTALNRLLTFSPSSGSSVVTVNIIDDNIVENSEFFNGNLGTTDGAVNLGPISATVTISEVVGDDSIRVGFDPDSYLVDETDGSVIMTVTILEGTLERDAIVFFSTTDGSATSVTPADFVAVSDNPITFTPSISSNDVTVNIVNDDNVEASESFYGNLSTSDSAVNLSPSAARVTIAEVEGDDSVIIGFDPDSYRVSEKDGTVTFVIKVIGGNLERDAEVSFFTTDGTATSTSPKDFTAVSDEKIIFGPSTDSNEVSVTIEDDNIVESSEFFFGNLSTTDMAVNLNPSGARVDITEVGGDDSIQVGFDPDSYSVNEKDNTVALTVKIVEGTLERDAVVFLSTTDGSATSIDPMDFFPLFDEPITFTPSISSSVVVVVIVDDNIVEDSEFFFGNLSTSDDSIRLEPSAARVTIVEVDDDSIRVGFDPDSYRVNEVAGEVVLTVKVLNGTLERNATVFFSTTDGSATSTAPIDFVAVTNEELVFTPSISSNDIAVTIVNDNIVESTEMFFGNLATADTSVNLNPDSASVTIPSTQTGEETITIGMDQGRVIVNEDIGMVELCASVMSGSIERQAVVSVIYVDRSAMSGVDYVGNNVLLTFSPEMMQQCFNVSIIDDESFENTEEFFVNLTTSDQLVELSPMFTVVVITDEEVITVGWEQTRYIVTESIGRAQLCAIAMVNGRPGGQIQATVSSVSIILQGDSAVPGFDYESVPDPSSFNFNRDSGSRLCTLVTILQDDTLETNESFTADLMVQANSRVNIDPGQAEVVITDEDIVVVGFGNTNLTVPEDVMTFMMCVLVEGGASFDINVQIDSQSASAVPGDDYIPAQIPSELVIPAGQDRVCFNSTAIVDDTNQEPTESFMLEITGTDPSGDSIVVNPNTARITIIDNDVDSGVRVNDTVIGDPLYTVPIRVSEEQLDALGIDRISLCYEVHGKSEQWFNLVTDDCTSVNTRYAMLTPRLNIMNAIAVRAVDSADQCVNIRVDVAQCTVTVGNMSLDVMSKYDDFDIMVKRYSNRVRISVPNCQDLSLVMWVICENRTLENPDSLGTMITSKMIKYVVMRGLNFGHRQAHGLLGQFWNIPVSIGPYNGLLTNGDTSVGRYVVNITTSGVSRSYTGIMHGTTWDHSEGPCLFVGNRQSGPIREVSNPNDPVIENLFSNYEVKEPFAEDDDYKFGMFDEGRCDQLIPMY